MKNLLLGVALMFVFSSASTAQEKRLASAPPAFRTFYSTFKSALERSDKVGVANMTRFPFSWGLDAGDEGTYNRVQFVKNFKRLFDDEREMLRERNPRYGRDEDGVHYISTEDAGHLGFVKSGNTYKFVSYIVEP